MVGSHMKILPAAAAAATAHVFPPQLSPLGLAL